MSLEVLPNEILLDIFSYFTGVELLRTFYALNNRFNILLHHQFCKCSFQFTSISKHDFDVICQQYLPRMAQYMRDLQFSDHEQTPTEIKLFLSYISSFHIFTQLESLSFSFLRSYQLLSTIIDGCYQLDNLTHLKFNSCYFDTVNIDFQSIIDRIWNLPKLLHCTLGIGSRGQTSFPIPTIVSSSIQSLSMEKFQLKLDQINRLFQQTPNLQSLSISIPSFNDNNYTSSALSNLTNLSISSVVNCNASNIGILLQNTPNIRYLNIDLSTEIIDGARLEDIIRNHLSKLEILRLKMKVICQADQNVQNRINTLINSFQTPFWIDEHQWFVRCLTSNKFIYLYTLSECYEDELPIVFQITNFVDDEREFYRNLTKLTTPTFFEQSILSSIQLTNIHTLAVNLPLNDRFWSIMSNFDRLKSLTLFLHNNSFQSQVQELLNRAFRLHKLTIKQHESIPLPNALFQYKNLSIHELDLRNINHYFNADQCMKLSQSPLGKQCEILSILVKNCESITTLIDNMPKLRALNIRCKEGKSFSTSKISNTNQNENLIWFQKQLPSKCVVVEDLKLSCNILIWV